MGRSETSCWHRRSTFWTIFILAAFIVSLIATWQIRGSQRDFAGLDHDAILEKPVLTETLIPCLGPRGAPLDTSEDDKIWETILDGEVPQPYAGSYSELGLAHTWTDRNSRYGPYGLGAESAGYTRGMVFWDKIDWANLQNKCLQRNLRSDLRPGSVHLISPRRRLSMPTRADGGHWLGSLHTLSRRKHTTGRTAIVIRAYDSYTYRDEDIWNMRALITETALQYGGRYSVFLMVDVHGNYDVIRNSMDYEAVLDSVPAEFRNMTVLFDQRNFLKAWYPRILEWRPEFQLEQARQLFARQFPEFDHYWQMQLDVRFTGNAGNFIHAIEEFARNEPRKQARERSSFTFTRQTYDTYANFTSHVNEAMNGGSSFWPGARLPDIEPIGPLPPTIRPEDDLFEWGVGEEADLILLSPTINVTLSKGWEKYSSWIFNFKQKQKTPRMASAPCISRCSWNLLNMMHEAQIWDGKRLHSEATPPSFALWHGLKISHPPFPIYGLSAGEHSAQDIDVLLNGGLPSREHNGMSWGSSHGDHVNHQNKVKELGPTWDSQFAGASTHAFRVWLEGRPDVVEKADIDMTLPIVRNGKILLPNLMLHPVRTSSNVRPPKNPKIPE